MDSQLNYFIQARSQPDISEEEIPSIFQESRQDRSIIPPIGIASKELVYTFQQNLTNEENLRKKIKEIEDYKNETIGQTTTRETLSHVARGLESFLGGIGEFVDFILPNLNEEDEQDQSVNIRLPKTEFYREQTKKLTGDYLEPKSEESKISQETIGDISSMFSTGQGLGFWTKLLAPIGGQITKQVIKNVGGSEKEQNYGKLGFMLMSTLANTGNARNAANQAYKEAVNLVPKGVKFNANPITNGLSRLKNQEWYKTGVTPSKNPAFEEISRIEKSIKNGKLDAHRAMQLRKDINEQRKLLKGFSLERPIDKEQALFYLDRVDEVLLNGMESYGKNVNPKWWKSYNLANEAIRITNRSQLISDALQKYAKPLQSEAAKTLFQIGAASSILKFPAFGAVAAPVLGGAKSIQIMNRMVQSPVLRNHYANVLRYATAGNIAQMNKALKSFDEAAYKMEKHQNKNSSSSLEK